MALPAPNLDDRKFQDIVTEARSLIPRYCPEWTDHNLSDPGITLIELFAWMVDILLYRLNKVPEKNYIKFLDLIGVKLLPAHPAKADISFRLSAPQPEPVTVPRGTEVATVRTETQDAVSFTTVGDLRIEAPEMVYCMICRGGTTFHDYMPVLQTRELMDIFQKVPQRNDAFYIGYNKNLAGNTLRLIFETSIEGIGVDPRNPPLAWQFWDGEDSTWARLRLESDATGGLNKSGEVILHVPYSCDLTEVDGKNACWIRCRVRRARPRQPAYTNSPRVRGVDSHCVGGTVSASHAFKVVGEVLGRSNGDGGQIFYLQNTPVLSRDDGETVEVEEEEGRWQPWQEVKDFWASGPDDLHFICDSVSGEIQFGPRLRQPDGEERQFGATPRKGKRVRFSSYRCGGGVQGNVGEKTVTVLKSSIPYVASVTNWEVASGGTDSESLESAKLRAPQVLKARTRAVTAEDFEYLAYEASSGVARAKCLVPKSAGEKDTSPPGTVRLLIVPLIAAGAGTIRKEELVLLDHLRQEVTNYLDERRLLTTKLVVSEPKYRWVTAGVKVKAKAKTDPKRLKGEIEKKLSQFINPITGGPENAGWPFDRDVLASDVHSLVQALPGVDYVEGVDLFVEDVETGKLGEATAKVSLSPGQLPCSFEHKVAVT
ncbi:MAG: putative baseplate assembly protein [Dehalococcoidia bacterium]|nr:putative baseplate assembly protein [Dehalococcoidia bacterium]